MDKAEFGKWAAALKTYYPREEKLIPNKEAMELWFAQLGDIPYDVATIALNKWVVTEKWSPSIAEFRRCTLDVLGGGAESWGSAWEKVLEAIRRYGSYEPAKALASLPPAAAEAARQIGWRNLCMSENQAADRAHFQKVYEIAAERQTEKALLPKSLLELIAQKQIGALEKKEEQNAE
jgi:hypothetical protein